MSFRHLHGLVTYQTCTVPVQCALLNRARTCAGPLALGELPVAPEPYDFDTDRQILSDLQSTQRDERRRIIERSEKAKEVLLQRTEERKRRAAEEVERAEQERRAAKKAEEEEEEEKARRAAQARVAQEVAQEAAREVARKSEPRPPLEEETIATGVPDTTPGPDPLIARIAEMGFAEEDVSEALDLLGRDVEKSIQFLEGLKMLVEFGFNAVEAKSTLLCTDCDRQKAMQLLSEN